MRLQLKEQQFSIPHFLKGIFFSQSNKIKKCISLT